MNSRYLSLVIFLITSSLSAQTIGTMQDLSAQQKATATGVVDIDVGRIRPNHALMGPQGGIDDRQIGLSTANQEMNVQIAVFAKGTYPLGGTAAVVIRSVAGSLLHIGFYKRLQYLRVTAFGVVIVKINHFGHLTFFSPIVLP